jgi:alpha-1,2-glucosyltransferase
MLTVVITITTLFAVSTAVSRAQPEAYMDEVYHIPQAQRFCRGSAEWDGNITTPAGVYALPAAVSLVAHSWGAGGCSTPVLRSWSGAWLLSTAALVTVMVRQRSRAPAAALLPVLVVTYPPLLFSATLFYTDTASVFWALATLAALPQPHVGAEGPSMSSVCLAALVGGVSILFRQTNVVWLAYAAAQCALPGALRNMAGEASRWSIYTTVRPFLPLAVPFGAFAVFVWANGGIVLGDKSAHVPSLNLTQLGLVLLCVGAFCVLELAAVLVTAAPQRSAVHHAWLELLRARVSTRPVVTSSPDAGILPGWYGTALLLCFSLSLAPLLYRVPTHPYNLADNRHATFYLFSKLLTPHPWLKAALAPVYAVCGMLFFTRVAANTALARKEWERRVGWGQAAVWLVGSASVLVPAPLLELRYLAVPLATALLLLWGAGGRTEPRVEEASVWHPTAWACWGIMVVYGGLNAISAWLFVTRPFPYGDGKEVGRFMW